MGVGVCFGKKQYSCFKIRNPGRNSVSLSDSSSLVLLTIQKTAPASTPPTRPSMSRPTPRSTWRWTAGPSARTRTRCWTWPSLWAPSCCLPSRCPWASSWTNMVRESYDFWAGKAWEDNLKPVSTWFDIILNSCGLFGLFISLLTPFALCSQCLLCLLLPPHRLWCQWSQQ